MNIEAEKIELVKRLLDINNDALIIQVKELLENHEKELWDDLPAHVKAGIERGKKQADAGMFTPHEEVMKKYEKYL
jgi:hypothetical protein